MAETDPLHPSQHRGRVKWWQQAVGLLGAPVAWVAEISINFVLADFGCRAMSGVQALTIATSVASTVACIASTWVAYGVWKQTRGEAKGKSGKAIDVGEGRSRFFAMTGMLAGGIFLATSLANLLSAWMVRPC